MTSRYTMPNWCNPCGRYHSRDYQDCERRAAVRHPEPAIDVDKLADLIAEKLAARTQR